MRKAIYTLYSNIENNLDNLKQTVRDESIEFDVDIISMDIKHILEDMQSILDYIAVDIHRMYCPMHNLKKIYFVYSSELEDEIDFQKRISRNFPKLYDDFKDIYDVLASTQSFSDNSNWIVKLNDLTNEVKHNELYISNVKLKKNTTLSSENATLQVVGDLSVKKVDNGYGVFGTEAVYVCGNGKIGFYSDGNLAIGNGVYNVDSKMSKGIKIEYYEYKMLFSKKYNIEITSILSLILEKEKQLISALEKYI